MNTVLVVVDMQNDFITGALGTPEARAILPYVLKKIQSFTGKILVAQDTHTADYLDTREGQWLPVEHCIVGTGGHAVCDELMELEQIKKAAHFEKNTFGSTALAKYLCEVHQKKRIDAITLIGLCTDICVVSNALLIKAFLPEVRIVVDAACCAGVTPEKHAAALETMRSCQIEIHQGIVVE